MKIAICTGYGSFQLSPQGMFRFFELQNKPLYAFKKRSSSEFENEHEYYKALPILLTKEEACKFNRSYDLEFANVPEWFPNPNVPSSNEESVWFNEHYISSYDIGSIREDRTDPLLIQVIKELGSFACDDLKIVEVPDDVKWHIECSDDGGEWIAENHRTWF